MTRSFPVMDAGLRAGGRGHVSVRRVQPPAAGYGTCTTDKFAFKLKLRFWPVIRRAPARRRSLRATAVSAQLRSIANGCVPERSVICQKVPMLENIQYQNAMIRQVPPQAA